MSPILQVNNAQLKSMIKLENTVYRAILKEPQKAPIVTLRMELGASNMKSRLIKSKISYYYYIMKGNNLLLKHVLKKKNLIKTQLKGRNAE